MRKSSASSTTLGLDIGSNSVGWALIQEENEIPQSIKATGVRIFEEGVNLDAKSGKTESRNVKRREARLRRRQIARHAQRKKNTHVILASAGLLPPGPPQHNNSAWKEILDADPYALRAKALDCALNPSELGRIFYHLAERRGYQSNRKKPVKDDEHGKVKDGIKRLSAELEASRARTIGEYFHGLNPHEVRIRTHYTRRDMFEREFDLVWEIQEKHNPQLLTPTLKKKLRDSIFNQRPLLIRSGMLGKCELEPSRRRAPMALLHVQEFRMLQDINHLRIENGTAQGQPIPSEARVAILNMLQERAEVTFGSLRTKIPGLKKCQFNLERGDRKTLCGNSTAARIRAALGDKWDKLDESSRIRLVNDLISILHDGALRGRLTNYWSFTPDEVELLAETTLEDDHAALSSSAILKLLPHLRAGKSYREAIDSVTWAQKPEAQETFLPPLADLRNPIVQRALAETRRVVNALIAKYGRPDRIRVELARELKLNRDDRAEYIRSVRDRERERSQARAELITNGLPDPKRRDIEKWLLLVECGGRCPYTGKQINFNNLFRENEFDIEHILPFSRSLDDSFANKTLCHVHANRVEKKEKTPFEVFGNTPRFVEILDRVARFTGPFAESKLRRFKEESLTESAAFADSFTQRQLNDTKYASVRAARYLRCLYPEQDRLKAVQVSMGRVTAYLRSAWSLNRILGDGPNKSRDDHRHHAVDALCVALTSPSTVRMLSESASRWDARGGRVGVFHDVPEPWASFYEEAEAAIGKIVVSHRVSRKVQGQLHQETHYGLIQDPYTASNNKNTVAVLRVRLEDLSANDVKEILDKAVREAVQDKLQGGDPKKVFKNGQNPPQLKAKNGSVTLIKKVRIRCGKMSLIDLGPERRVAGGNNHHLELFDEVDKKGKRRWRGLVVTMMEAMTRLRENKPLINTTGANGSRFLFSLVQGDIIRCKRDGASGLFRVTTLSPGFYECRHITDARMSSIIRASKERVIFSDKSLQDGGAIKLSVDPLGHYHETRD